MLWSLYLDPGFSSNVYSTAAASDWINSTYVGSTSNTFTEHMEEMEEMEKRRVNQFVNIIVIVLYVISAISIVVAVAILGTLIIVFQVSRIKRRQNTDFIARPQATNNTRELEDRYMDPQQIIANRK